MPTITPYLTVSGAHEALDWYADVLGATHDEPMVAEDGKRIMHATMTVRGDPVMMSDSFPEYGGHPAPDPQGDSPVAIGIQLDEPGEVDAIFNTAISRGARESHPPEDMFWGDRFAQFIDPFGHRWMLTARLADTA